MLTAQTTLSSILLLYSLNFLLFKFLFVAHKCLDGFWRTWRAFICLIYLLKRFCYHATLKIRKKETRGLDICDLHVRQMHDSYEYTAQILGEDLARSHGKLSNACINIFVPGSQSRSCVKRSGARSFLHARRKTAGYGTSNLTARKKQKEKEKEMIRYSIPSHRYYFD